MQTAVSDRIVSQNSGWKSNGVESHSETHRFQNSDWKNNGVESHSGTHALAVLCEYQHVASITIRVRLHHFPEFRL